MEVSRGIDARVQSARREVDDFLTGLPPRSADARRAVTRELQFEPSDEELDTILEIAVSEGRSSCCRDLAARWLALRVQVERLLRGFWSERRLRAEQLARIGPQLVQLQSALRRVSDDIESQRTPDGADQAFLARTRESLAWPERRIAAVEVLAPRLELIAKQISGGNVSETFPGLSDDEIEMFNRAVYLEDDESAGASRTCLDAVALRTIYEECGDEWRREGYLDDEPLIERLRQSVEERLEAADAAYHVVDDSLRLQGDEATAAGLAAFAGELDAVERRLSDARFAAGERLRGS